MKNIVLACALLFCPFAAFSQEPTSIAFSFQSRTLFPEDASGDAMLQAKLSTPSPWQHHSYGLMLGYLPDQASSYRFYGQTYKVQKYRYVGAFINKRWKLDKRVAFQSSVAPILVYGRYLHVDRGDVFDHDKVPLVARRNGFFVGLDVAANMIVDLNRQVFFETSLGLTPSTFRDFEGNILGLMHFGAGLGIKI